MTLFVNVKDNNVEQAIRSLKKKMQREGLYKEMKLRCKIGLILGALGYLILARGVCSA